MIPQAFITEWQTFAPWATEAQVEQDLILSRVLVAIYSHPLLENSLAFRGGTALHKLFIQPAARYSEDIDLVQINEGPIGPILEALRTQLNHWLGEPRWKTNQGRATLVYRFDSEIPPVTSMRVKIEINTREHFSILGLTKKSFELSSQWFSEKVEVTTFHLEELVATKLRALYQRKKGRDLFDLIVILKEHPDIDIIKMLLSFAQYMAFDQTKVSRAEFESNLAAKLKDKAFNSDILPLLPPINSLSYNSLEEVHSVREKIINLLPGEPWRGST